MERWEKGKEGRVGRFGRTLRVVLQDVDVAVRVPDGYVELSLRREEGGRYNFYCVGRFAEEAELVGFLLYSDLN